MFPSIRSLVLTALAGMVLASVQAASLTPPQYNALTVTSEVQVEALASAVALVNNADASTAFDGFLTAFGADVTAGTLTVTGHNQRIDDFLQNMNALVPDFSTTAEAAIAAAVVDFFKFQRTVHTASWDVLFYGASAAQAQVGNPTTRELLQTVDGYMKVNAANGSVSDLQAQCDSFFTQVDAAVPSFTDVAYKTIGKLYTSLWNQESNETSHSSQMEDSAAPSGDSGTNATSTEDVEFDESSMSPTPTTKKTADNDGTPSPARTSRATSFISASSIAMTAITLAYTILLM